MILTKKEQIYSIRLISIFIAMLWLSPGTAAAKSGTVGIHVGLILPRDNYIRYSDLAPKLSFHYAPDIKSWPSFATRFDLGAAYFKSSNRNRQDGFSVYASRLREYGYTFHAGLQYCPSIPKTWSQHMTPSVLVQPGLYLMNTEIEYMTSPQDQSPSLDHQFMGRFGLRLGFGLDFFSPHESRFTLGISWDYIPRFERSGGQAPAFKDDSRAAQYWTISLGFSVPFNDDDDNDDDDDNPEPYQPKQL